MKKVFITIGPGHILGSGMKAKAKPSCRDRIFEFWIFSKLRPGVCFFTFLRID